MEGGRRRELCRELERAGHRFASTSDSEVIPTALSPAIVEADGRRSVETYWRANFRRRSEHAEWDEGDWSEAC
jgi:sugar/nucleoside kinase (ribokinase family)